MIRRQLKAAVPNHVFDIVSNISKESGQSISQTVENLILYAFDYLEDDYLSILADEAEKKSISKSSISYGGVHRELGV